MRVGGRHLGAVFVAWIAFAPSVEANPSSIPTEGQFVSGFILSVLVGLNRRDAVDDIARLIAYDHWANGEALASIERTNPPPPKALALMGHVFATEAGWMKRMGHEAAFDGFWPQEDAASLAHAWKDELPACWSSFLADTARSDPARTIAYTNSRGQSFRSGVRDVLIHVLLHSAYHRGQVASQVRAAGGEPANTDFIHATRSGFIPPARPAS
jgi:uncharacterized damage-inducible protein DinB